MTSFLEADDHFLLKHSNIPLLKPQILWKGIHSFCLFRTHNSDYPVCQSQPPIATVYLSSYGSSLKMESPSLLADRFRSLTLFVALQLHRPHKPRYSASSGFGTPRPDGSQARRSWLRERLVAQGSWIVRMP